MSGVDELRTYLNPEIEQKVSDYVQQTLLKRSVAETTASAVGDAEPEKDTIDVKFLPTVTAAAECSESKSYVFLVDLSVRTLSDLAPALEAFPFWPRLRGKMEASKQSVAQDKFLYTHDIGDTCVWKVAVARIPLETYQMLDLAKRIASNLQTSTIVVSMTSQFGETALNAAMCEALVAGIQAQRFNMPSLKAVSPAGVSARSSTPVAEDEGSASANVSFEFIHGPKTEEGEGNTLSSYWRSISTDISAIGVGQLRLDILATCAINHGTNITRALATLPPNALNPYLYTTMVIRRFANRYGWEISEWTASELRDEGCGAFWAVAQANRGKGYDRLIRLKYKPRNTKPATALDATTDTVKPVVLVGKGVCYDSGGINLKTADSMRTMKQDMHGSAAALSTLYALSETDFPYPVECWMAIVENNVDSHAYRPDDVVMAVTGDTIEVVHSDAEGRMILSDVLALASRKVIKPVFHSDAEDLVPPRLLIDYATLTYTCISSLSKRYIGAVTNRKEYVSRLISAGERCGERVWPFPCDEDYEEDLKSTVADTIQCRQEEDADHIYAALFLKRFVNPAVPWVHLDLASANRSGGLGHIPSDYTGCGVRAAAEIIRQLC
jgi:leucyl aminopeptidase